MHFSRLNTSLSDRIIFDYGVHTRQITGGPAWIESEKYDLAAQPEGEGQPNTTQWKAMLQKLLADRFKLNFHREACLIYHRPVQNGPLHHIGEVCNSRVPDGQDTATPEKL